MPVIFLLSEHSFHYLAIKSTMKIILIFKLHETYTVFLDKQHILHLHLNVNKQLHRRQH